MKRAQPRTPAFTLPDTAAIVLVCAAMAALLIATRPRQRALGQLGESMSNLRELGVGFEAYGRDNADRVATFSWKAGTTPSTYPDLAFAATDIDAAGYQAVDIIRRRANLTMAQLPRQSSWIPNVQYSHLALIDYSAHAAPWNTAISPGDAILLQWASDPLKWQSNGAPSARHPFASSYELPTAFTSSPDSGPDAISQTAAHNAYMIPGNAKLGGRTLSEVAYPANKALMYERVQWFFGPRVAYFLYDEARVPVLAADGNVQVRKTKQSNRGWQPNAPTSPAPSFFSYSPAPYEPAVLSGVSNTVSGGMRWTRRASAGRDFDAAEVP